MLINVGKNVYEIYIDIKLYVMKPIHARWIISLRNSTKMIVEAFNMTGIAEVISLEVMEDGRPLCKIARFEYMGNITHATVFMLFRLRPKSFRICPKNMSKIVRKYFGRSYLHLTQSDSVCSIQRRYRTRKIGGFW